MRGGTRPGDHGRQARTAGASPKSSPNGIRHGAAALGGCPPSYRRLGPATPTARHGACIVPRACPLGGRCGATGEGSLHRVAPHHWPWQGALGVAQRPGHRLSRPPGTPNNASHYVPGPSLWGEQSAGTGEQSQPTPVRKSAGASNETAGAWHSHRGQAAAAFPLTRAPAAAFAERRSAVYRPSGTCAAGMERQGRDQRERRPALSVDDRAMAPLGQGYDHPRMDGLLLLVGGAIGFIGLLGGVLLAVAAMTGGAGPDERRRY